MSEPTGKHYRIEGFDLIEMPDRLEDVPCDMRRHIGGWWCNVHRCWADNCPVQRNSEEAFQDARRTAGLA